jgi:hypothetical protein
MVIVTKGQPNETDLELFDESTTMVQSHSTIVTEATGRFAKAYPVTILYIEHNAEGTDLDGRDAMVVTIIKDRTAYSILFTPTDVNNETEMKEGSRFLGSFSFLPQENTTGSPSPKK